MESTRAGAELAGWGLHSHPGLLAPAPVHTQAAFLVFSVVWMWTHWDVLVWWRLLMRPTGVQGACLSPWASSLCLLYTWPPALPQPCPPADSGFFPAMRVGLPSGCHSASLITSHENWAVPGMEVRAGTMGRGMRRPVLWSRLAHSEGKQESVAGQIHKSSSCSSRGEGLLQGISYNPV